MLCAGASNKCVFLGFFLRKRTDKHSKEVTLYHRLLRVLLASAQNNNLNPEQKQKFVL